MDLVAYCRQWKCFRTTRKVVHLAAACLSAFALTLLARLASAGLSRWLLMLAGCSVTPGLRFFPAPRAEPIPPLCCVLYLFPSQAAW